MYVAKQERRNEEMTDKRSSEEKTDECGKRV